MIYKLFLQSGVGQVIKGWDLGWHEKILFFKLINWIYILNAIPKGLMDMCEGEKRKLIIPSHLGYGENGAGAKIPGKLIKQKFFSRVSLKSLINFVI